MAAMLAGDDLSGASFHPCLWIDRKHCVDGGALVVDCGDPFEVCGGGARSCLVGMFWGGAKERSRNEHIVNRGAWHWVRTLTP